MDAWAAALASQIVSAGGRAFDTCISQSALNGCLGTALRQHVWSLGFVTASARSAPGRSFSSILGDIGCCQAFVEKGVQQMRATTCRCSIRIARPLSMYLMRPDLNCRCKCSFQCAFRGSFLHCHFALRSWCLRLVVPAWTRSRASSAAWIGCRLCSKQVSPAVLGRAATWHWPGQSNVPLH